MATSNLQCNCKIIHESRDYAQLKENMLNVMPGHLQSMKMRSLQANRKRLITQNRF